MKKQQGSDTSYKYSYIEINNQKKKTRNTEENCIIFEIIWHNSILIQLNLWHVCIGC